MSLGFDLRSRMSEARIREELDEHFSKSKQYFINVFSLVGFVLLIAVCAIIQNHRNLHANYHYYDFGRYEGMVEHSVLDAYATVKGEKAIPTWTQYQETIQSSTLPVVDQNYLLAQQALILDLPKSEETAKLSNYFEHEVSLADLNYIKADHNILNKYVYNYSPFYGTERQKFVKIELRIDNETASEIFKENSVQRFMSTALGLVKQFNEITLPIINVGIVYVGVFAFIFAIVYGVLNNLMRVYDILND